jgi:hypothetical protein
MYRFPRSVAGVSVAVLATATFAPPAIAATTAPPPPAQAAGLLDDLLGLDLGRTLNDLLGTDQQNELTTLLNSLLDLNQSGTEPTGALLAPLTDLLSQLSGTSGLLDQIAGLLNSGGSGPLSPSLLAPVAALLDQLAGVDGLPAPIAQLLQQLADALAGGGDAGLPVNGVLTLPQQVIDSLTSVLNALENGGQPTAELLRPLVALLSQVAGADGVPQPLRDLINQLIDTLNGTTGALDPLVTSQLSTVLDLVRNTPSVDRSVREIIDRTTTILDRTANSGTVPTNNGGGTNGGGSGGGITVIIPGQNNDATPKPTARKATAADRAVVKKVTLNAARSVATVRIACPSSAPATCAVTAGARWHNKIAVRRTISTRIGAGKAKTAKLRLTKAATKGLKRSGGSITVNLKTTFGSQHFSLKKGVKVAKVKAKRR